MARSQQRKYVSRFRNGLLWNFVVAPPASGTLRDRFVFKDSYTSVEVFPPSGSEPCWLVAVDGIEVLELFGHMAETRAFAVADAFALQVDPFTHVLKEQGYVKLPRQRVRRRR